jgi:hypothetical protein
MIMIIGISGKIGSGKDTIGSIIQFLTDEYAIKDKLTYQQWVDEGLEIAQRDGDYNTTASDWEIKKFAGKVKQIASLITGVPVEKFEDQEFKNSLMPDKWKAHYLVNPAADKFLGRPKGLHYSGPFVSKEACEEACLDLVTSNSNYYVTEDIITYRKLLQLLGTDAMRTVIHPNVWVNALFADYRTNFEAKNVEEWGKDLSQNWIITDVRFPNEADAIKERGGLLIRVNRKLDRPLLAEEMAKNMHPSETALDNYPFPYTIDNNDTIDDLVESVRTILKKEKII